MPRILLVKTSSLGDVVHNLPVASDIAKAFPGAEIDWVVEEAFAPLPALHPAVRRAIPVAIRRWRASLWDLRTWRELRSFIEILRAVRYDAVVDTQGLFKSALISRAARGKRYGLGWRASREPLHPFYDRTFHVPRNVHAVDRNRLLAAKALGYENAGAIDYGIAGRPNGGPVISGAYAVLLHATSARDKLWPEEHWIDVARALASEGVRAVLPWGSDVEHERSRRLAVAISGAVVPGRMAIGELASLLARAHGVVGVDTGLTHLAGALGVPTVGIYVATDPARTGLRGCTRAANLGGRAQVPSTNAVLQTLRDLSR